MPTIRPYAPQDAAALAAIYFRAVREVGPLAYSPTQVEAWAPEPPTLERYLARGEDGRLILVAVEDADAPIAYADLEADGHVDHLFCRPDWVGKGVASALCDAVETEARARGLARLYVEASEIALPLFRRKGFTVVERRDFELRGVPLHHYRMEKIFGGRISAFGPAK